MTGPKADPFHFEQITGVTRSEEFEQNTAKQRAKHITLKVAHLLFFPLQLSIEETGTASRFEK